MSMYRFILCAASCMFGSSWRAPGSSWQQFSASSTDMSKEMEEDSAVLWVLDTLTICLQQSWVSISQAFPQISSGKAARASTVPNGARTFLAGPVMVLN